jgi:hypothetical protein
MKTNTANNTATNNPKQIKKSLAAFRAGAMPVNEVGFMAAGPVFRLPVAAVNALHRNDLLDLYRVHRSELELFDGFDTDSSWNFCLHTGGHISLARLDVRITKPVRVSFKVLFDLNKNFDFLTAAGSSEVIGVYFKPQPWQKALAIQHPRQSLLDGLRLSASMKSAPAPGQAAGSAGKGGNS